MADPTLIPAVATVVAASVTGVFLYLGSKKERGDGVSLVKTVMDDKNRESARLRKELREMQARLDGVEAERDHLRYELDFAHARLRQLGDPQ